MKTRTLAFAALTFAGACASMSNQQHYADYAGASVSEVNYSNLYNWQRTGDRSIVIWTRPTVAYLLTLNHECSALDGRVTIEIGDIDGVKGRLQAGSGNVMVSGMRCRVGAIQPIDLERMKRERRS